MPGADAASSRQASTACDRVAAVRSAPMRDVTRSSSAASGSACQSPATTGTPGRAGPQPPHQVAQPRQARRAFQVGDADYRHAGHVQPLDLATGHRGGGHHPAAQAALGHDLRHHRAGRLVQRAAARRRTAPSRRRLPHAARHPHGMRRSCTTSATDARTCSSCSSVSTPLSESLCRHKQPAQGDLVVIGGQGALLQQHLRLVERLVGIARQDALVEALGGRQRRTVAEQHVDELQVLHVPPEHHQAQRERHREDEPNRAPQPGPEDRRDHHRHRRQPGAVAIQQRLQHLARDPLDHQEQRRRLRHHGPSGIDRGPPAPEAEAPRPRRRRTARNAGARR